MARQLFVVLRLQEKDVNLGFGEYVANSSLCSTGFFFFTKAAREKRNT